jgi:fumarate hydratase subunit beta
MRKINTPISNKLVNDLKIGDKILISGTIFTGRDAVLPKLKEKIVNCEIEEIPFDLEGSIIMHTAVSSAGISPTTSNKEEIESSIPELSKSGVKIHIGKGILSEGAKNALEKENSIFVVTPSVNALITNSVKSKKILDYENEGIEAMFSLEVEEIPVIVAIAHGKTIY